MGDRYTVKDARIAMTLLCEVMGKTEGHYRKLGKCPACNGQGTTLSLVGPESDQAMDWIACEVCLGEGKEVSTFGSSILADGTGGG